MEEYLNTLDDDDLTGCGLDIDTIEKLGFRVRGHHKGIVYPMSIDISSNRIVAYQEPGFSLDLPKEKRDNLILSFCRVPSLTNKLRDSLDTLKEENKYFSFYDKRNKRYINSIDDYTASFNKFFHYYLNRVYQFYRIGIREYDGILRDEKYFCFPIAAHDFNTIEELFHGVGRIVLDNNKYNFFRANRSCRNKDEEEYCKMATEVLTELMIKYYNYLRYNIDPNDKEKSEMLLNAIETNYQSHVEEANKQNNILKMMLRM